MTIINQTNRTLLLEEINPEKLDLLTLIGDVKGIDSLSDDKIKEINQYLECRSYEEFQEKFAPCIYSFFDANTQSVRYTLKKPENIPENMLTEIPLNQSNDFLKMLFKGGRVRLWLGAPFSIIEWHETACGICERTGPGE